MEKFCVKVPATVANLGPGFDILGMALDIYNEFHVERSGEQKLEICVEGEGKDNLSHGEDNLFYGAFLMGFNTVGGSAPHVRIQARNAIPIDRGLGSSATAILGGLLAAREMIGNAFPPGEVLRLAIEMEGHADNIMAAYMGGIVINYEKDGVIEGSKILPARSPFAALAIPELKISTDRARAILPDIYPRQDVVTNLRNISLLVLALKTGDFDLLKIAMEDRVHQPYRIPLIPGFDEIKEAAIAQGAHGVAISGSGPTILAICSGNAEKVAEAMAGVFIEKGFPCRHMVAGISEQGAQVIRG